MPTMSIQEIRRANFRAFVNRNGGVTSVAKRLGASVSYVSQLTKGRSPIGEKAARSIEKCYLMRQYTLDQAPGEDVPFAHTNNVLLAQVIRAVGDALEAKKLKPSPAKFAELVAVVYEHSVPANQLDKEYVARVVALVA